MNSNDLFRLFQKVSLELTSIPAALPPASRQSRAATVVAAQMDEAIAHHAKQTFACAKGCSHCCYLNTDIKAGEAFVLANAVRKMPEEKSRDVIGRIFENARHRRTTSYRERFFAPQACALLDRETNTCSVYDVRPMNCRKWHSLDVSRCVESEYRDDPFPIDRDAMAAASVVYDAYDDAMGKHTPRGELHQGLLLALQPDAEARLARGENIFSDWRTMNEIAAAEEKDERTTDPVHDDAPQGPTSPRSIARK